MDSRVIAKLYEVDPSFRELHGLLYGVTKALDPADVHIDGASKKKKATAVGLVVGSAAEGMAVHRSLQRLKEPHVPNITSVKPVGFKPKLAAMGDSEGGRIAEVAFQAGNMAVGLAGARELTKKPKPPADTTVAKAYKLTPLNAGPKRVPSLKARAKPTLLMKGFRNPDPMARFAGRKLKATSAHAAEGRGPRHEMAPTRRARVGQAVAAGVLASGAAGEGEYRHKRRQYQSAQLGPYSDTSIYAKSLEWTGEISKIDADKRQVFGWCSLSTVDGQPVVDLQGDFVPLDEIEKSAYRYVLESRKGGDMHKRVTKGITTEWTEPKHTSDLIESFVVTPEKLTGMGLAADALPHGWWVGFKVNDDEQWALVKSGERSAFSIHGTGRRVPAFVGGPHGS